MRYYETLYIINPNLAEEDYQNVVAKFTNVVEKNGGVVTKVDEWGKKTLAYDIKKFDKGFYVLLQYCGEAGLTAELKREMSLDDRVLKYQTIKLSDNADPEKLKPEPGPEESEPTEAVEAGADSKGTDTENEGEKDGV